MSACADGPWHPRVFLASRGGSLFKAVLPAATTATAVYNADNQLTSWNGTTIAYDLNGNLTSTARAASPGMRATG